MKLRLLVLSVIVVLTIVCAVIVHGGPKRTGLICHEEGAGGGYTLFAPLRSTSTYLVDMQGRLVHQWESRYPPGHAVYLLENGHLLRCARDPQSETFHGGGLGGRIEEFDWDGNLVWEYVYADDTHCQHHDIEPLPNGNVLILAWERKTAKQAIAAGRNPELLAWDELWPDHIVEVRPEGKTGGTIVWEWHVWDHLIQDFDETKANYGYVEEHPELIDLNFVGHAEPVAPAEQRRLQSLGYIGGSPRPAGRAGVGDWNHTNSIDYNAELDQIVLSVLNFNEVWVIDHSTTTEQAAGHAGGKYGRGGDLLYRWGNPAAYAAGDTADRQLFAQHDARWIPNGSPGAGHILIFNNGRGRPGGNYSSVDEIIPPLREDGGYTRSMEAAFGPARPAWVYTTPKKADFFSGHISGAQRLANGNTLVCAGESGRLFEVDAVGKVVWEFVNPFVGDVRPPGPPPGGADMGPGRRPPRSRDGAGQRKGGPPHAHRGRRGPPGSGGGGDEANAMFRATRLPPGYAGFAGRDLSPKPEGQR